MKNKLVTLVLFCISFYAFAESDEHHDHAAHVHGEANIYVVIDDNSVFLEFESPAMNLLGFEHEPRNEEQHKLVASVNEQLMDFKTVVLFKEANCEQTEIELEMPFAEEEHQDHHHEHEHHAHKDEHEDHHDHDKDHEDSEHSDYHVSYAFECKKTVSAIDINLFNKFAGIEEVEVQWVNGNKQGVFAATPDKASVNID